MFILAGNPKEKIATAGVLIACLALVAFSIQVVRVHGSYALVFPVVSILIVVAIYKGMRAGYYVGRFIFGTSSILVVVGSINPFAYMDIEAERGSFLFWVLESFLIGIVAAFSFYCLGEHEVLRMATYEGEEKTKLRESRKRQTNLIVVGLILLFLATGIFGVGVASRELRAPVAH